MKSNNPFNGSRVIIADGAMGTLLIAEVGCKVSSAEANLLYPQKVSQVHRFYARAGADFLTTNTFSASLLRLQAMKLDKEFKRINLRAVSLAREIANEFSIAVAGNIGPSGELLQPAGKLSFDEVLNNFYLQARILEKAGVDFFLLETFTDLLEMKAAIAGVRRATGRPIMASFSFTQEDRLVNGTPPEVIAATFNRFNQLAVLGANCGTTLKNMHTVTTKLLSSSYCLVLCQPNAAVAGENFSEKNYSPQELTDFFQELYPLGVAVIGSCCGSTPDHTAALAREFKNRPLVKRTIQKTLQLSAERRSLTISKEKLYLIGERINPAGRKKLQQELLRGSLYTVRREALAQENAGAVMLDVNLNIPGLNLQTVEKACWSLQNLTELPLIIDSNSEEIIAAFLKAYRGRALINSISAEEKSLKKLLPLAVAFNVPFIASLLDERGVPSSPEERLKLAQKIVKRAKRLSIDIDQIIFDPLVSNFAAEPQATQITLQTIKLLKNEFPENSIAVGLSNISYGLPNRDLLNNAFLALAIGNGANLFIANPLSETLQNFLLSLQMLLSADRKLLDRFLKLQPEITAKSAEKTAREKLDLPEAIQNGDSYNACKLIEALLEKKSAMQVIKEEIIPIMNEIGERYQRQELFLPHLIAAAETVKTVFPTLRQKLPQAEIKSGTKVLLATVAGDIHDIGKNLVAAVLEGFNIEVIDAGKDVPAEQILKLIREKQVKIVGLSSLMTTTLPALEKTVKLIQEELPEAQIFIGGAVVNEQFARRLNVNYATDGMAMVATLRQLKLLGD